MSKLTKLSNDQQEIVDLLRNELAELIDADASCLSINSFEDQQDLLFEYKVHLEHLANALDIAGLSGLSFCTKRLSLIFKTLLESKTPVPQNLQIPLHNWGAYLAGYLQYICQAEKEEFYARQLISFLSQDEIPCRLSQEEAEHIQQLFNVSDLEVANDQEQLPQEISEQMVSLDVPKDVRQELLQGMLIELPEQTKQFEISISSFLQSGEFEDLTQAQRIAHTIKGAANVVSVHGMANLTHFTEDLLETAAKNLKQVPDGFDDFTCTDI